MLRVIPGRGKLIMVWCATLVLARIAAADFPYEPVKVLGPIPTDFKKINDYLPAESWIDPKVGKSCLSARTAAYENLRNWRDNYHHSMGRALRNSIKEAENEKAATKDPKRKKQIGEWETKLSEAVAKMNQQIDQEYEAAVKKVHFRIPCSGK